MIHHRLLQRFADGKTIIGLAKELNYPPYMLARLIVESIGKNGKKAVTEAMRNPIAKLGHVKDFDVKHENQQEGEHDRYVIVLLFLDLPRFRVTKNIT